MATTWLDILPYEIIEMIQEEVTRQHKQDLLQELKVELLQDIPGDNVWVNKPTMFHSIVVNLTELIMEHKNQIYTIKQWVETLELDIFEYACINCVLNLWQEQQETACYTMELEKKERYCYFIKVFLNMFSYQYLVSLRRFL